MFRSFFTSTTAEELLKDYIVWYSDQTAQQKPDWFKLRLEMAGTKRQNISVKFVGDTLHVDYVDYGARKKHHQYFLDHRMFDHAKISCKYVDGILSVDVPNHTATAEEKETNVEVK